MKRNVHLIAFFVNGVNPKIKFGLIIIAVFFMTHLSVLAAPNPLSNPQKMASVIKGSVKDAKGEALPGASITLKGKTSGGTSTDINGNFTIDAKAGDVLIVSFVGYETQEVAVGNQTMLNIVLKDTAGNLDEIVVIGYGTANKRDLTSSIVKVGGDEVADKPNSNPLTSLQSKVAGLSVVNNGTPGRAPDIRIRGTVSIGSVAPLYVVDGILNDNIDFVNPNDIESIEILKDPSSLAIFGVRGAAGVILVTTKKAKVGQITVNYAASVGVKTLVDKIKLANAAQFKTLYEEEKKNIGVDAPFDYSKWTGDTDWIGAVTRQGYFTSNNITISGSTDRNKMSASIGYITDQGVIKHQNLEKLMLSVNDEMKLSKAFKIGFNLNALNQSLPWDYLGGDDPTNPAGNLLNDARKVAPMVIPFDQASGLYSALPAIQNSGVINPLLKIENEYQGNLKKNFRTVGSVFGEVNFLEHFNFRSTFYADLSWQNTTAYQPQYKAWDATSDASFLYSPLTSLKLTNDTWKKYQQDHILTYKNTFGKNGLTATAGWSTNFTGYSQIENKVNQSTSGSAIPNDPRFWYLDNGFGDPSSKTATSKQYERTTASALFRVLYDYDRKYFLNASYRKDGSSQISPANRWQDFWAVGAAWDLTNEAFMKGQHFFNFLKIKGSFGVLGNQNTYGYDYPYYPGLTTGTAGVFGNNIYPAYSQAYLPNPNLKWETVTAKEIGVEFNALHNKLYAQINYYDKTTKDMMTFIPGINGATNGLDNVGSINNHGLELAATWTQNITKDFKISVGGNLTTYKNKVLSLQTTDFSIIQGASRTTVGLPIGYFYGYVVEGVYQSYADKLASPVVTDFVYGPGDLKYKDINGDGKITTADRTIIGNPTPDFSYGGNVNLTYKKFTLGLDFGGVYGNEIFRNWGSTESPFQRVNYAAFKMNRWTAAGTSNWDPILGQDHRINYEASTYAIEDGSYFRLRNAQIAYSLGNLAISKLKMKNARIYMNVQNLKTWKHNSGYTPEFGGSGTNTATSFGIDNAGGAIPRVTTFGLNVTF